jgi:two-component system, OmpR family, phosphate regulon response regulator PhoB
MVDGVETVLVIDDEEDILELLRFNLERVNLRVLRAADGNAGLTLALQEMPHIIVLDLMLPGRDGFQVFQELKSDSRTRDIPVLMLTAKAEVHDRIAGLKLGADDYVTKPFSPREVVLRVQSLLRRLKKSPPGTQLKHGPVFLDRASFRCCINGEPLELTTTEFKLMSLLLEAKGETVPRATLLRDVWGYTDLVMTRTLDTHVKRLREKLGEAAKHVETVRGEGYRFSLVPHS